MNSILIGEDDPFIADIYAKSFAKAGFKVDVANDGRMVLEKISHNHPDIVALDIDFGPGKMNGCEVLKELRSEEKTKNLKVIVLSNYNSDDITQKYNVDIDSFGIIKHFVKIETPVEEIVKTVKEILK